MELLFSLGKAFAVGGLFCLIGQILIDKTKLISPVIVARPRASSFVANHLIILSTLCNGVPPFAYYFVISAYISISRATQSLSVLTEPQKP